MRQMKVRMRTSPRLRGTYARRWVSPSPWHTPVDFQDSCLTLDPVPVKFALGQGEIFGVLGQGVLLVQGDEAVLQGPKGGRFPGLHEEPVRFLAVEPRLPDGEGQVPKVAVPFLEVEWMDLEGNSNSGTSAAFLDQLRQRHSGPLQVIWDNAPAHRGEAVREYLRRPGLAWPGAEAGEPPFSRGQALPGYSPDFNADEAIWGWAREEATGNLCLGSRAAVQERVGSFLARLTGRKDEVKRRCRTALQSRAETLLRASRPDSRHNLNAHPTLALV